MLGRQVAVGGQLLELQGLGGVYSDIFLPLHGEHQAHNAVIALAAVEAFFGAGARTAARHRRRPRRFRRRPSAPAGWNGCAAPQRFSSTPPTTRPAPRRWRRRWPTSSTSDFVVGVVSVMADKDVDGILAALEPAFDQIVVTHNGSPRALDVESLATRAEERFGPERVIASPTPARRHRDRDRARRGGRATRAKASPAGLAS